MGVTGSFQWVTNEVPGCVQISLSPGGGFLVTATLQLEYGRPLVPDVRRNPPGSTLIFGL